MNQPRAPYIQTSLEENENFKRQEEWLLNSGVIDTSGGVSAWFDSSQQSFSFFYPEITAYAITYLLGRYSQTGEAHFLNLARNSATWLLENAIVEKGCLTTLDRPGGVNSSQKRDFYSFDLAIVCNSLVLLSTYDKKYRAPSIEITQKLTNDYLSDQFLSHLEGEEGESKWSQKPNMHHAKNILPLVALHEIDKTLYSTESLKKIADYYHKKYKNRLETLKESELHPYLYYLEGIYLAEKRLGLQRYQEYIQQNLDFIIKKYEPRTLTSDVLAQINRLFYITEKINPTGPRVQHLEREIQSRINNKQKKGAAPGGLQFWARGHQLTHYNTWALIFNLQAQMARAGKLNVQFFA